MQGLVLLRTSHLQPSIKSVSPSRFSPPTSSGLAARGSWKNQKGVGKRELDLPLVLSFPRSVCLFVCLREVFGLVQSRFVGRIKKNPDRHQRRTYPGTERSCFDSWLGDISYKAQPSSHSKLLRPRLVVIIAWAPPDQALPCCSAFIIVVSRLGANSGEPPLLSTVFVNSLYCNKIPSSGVCDIYFDIFFFKHDFLYRAFTSIPSPATYAGY